MSVISVVIPSYNHARFLPRTLDSVLGQSFTDWEVVAIDDGSRDESMEILQGYAAKDSRIRVFSQPNRGAHETINRAIGLARSEWIAVLNSDDVFCENRLEKMLERLKAQRSDFGVSHVTHIDDAGREILEHPFKQAYDRAIGVADEVGFTYQLLIFNLAVSTSNFVFRRSLFGELGGFRSYPTCHDWDFILQAILKTRLTVVEEPLLQYRVHANNTISNRYDDYFDCVELLVRFMEGSLGAEVHPECPSERNHPVFFSAFLRNVKPFHYRLFQKVAKKVASSLPPRPSLESEPFARLVRALERLGRQPDWQVKKLAAIR